MWVMDWKTTPVVPTAFRSRLEGSLAGVAGMLGDADVIGSSLLRCPGGRYRRWNPPRVRAAGAILGSHGPV
jgi:hypothetical protein